MLVGKNEVNEKKKETGNKWKGEEEKWDVDKYKYILNSTLEGFCQQRQPRQRHPTYTWTYLVSGRDFYKVASH